MQFSVVSRMSHETKDISMSEIIIIKLLIFIGLVQAASLKMPILFPTEEYRDDCPEKERYHNETLKCWKPKTQGPCSKSMIYYPIDKKYGDCDCPLTSLNITPYIYDIASDQCFKSYQRAFCQPGEWLIFDNNGSPICSPNKCKDLQNEKPEENEMYPVVLMNNTCVRLLKSGKDICAHPSVVGIDQDTNKPVCIDAFSNFDIGVKGSFKCRSGTRRDRLGKCRPINSKPSHE